MLREQRDMSRAGQGVEDSAMVLLHRVASACSNVLAVATQVGFGALAGLLSAGAVVAGAAPPADDGIRFSCTPAQIARLEPEMDAYLASFGIPQERIAKRIDRTAGIAVYTLATPKEDVTTLNLKDRPELGVQTQVVRLPTSSGEGREVETVSQKEILLALLQHGRLTEFQNRACDLEALKDNIGIRQNTVAWAETLEWGWPDGGPSEWNEVYWKRGTPVAQYALHEALNDVFMNQKKYAIGCYTATKFVMIQGVLDYYSRIKKGQARLKIVLDRLLSDGEPLVDIEPGRMWEFETDYDPEELKRPGKILKIQHGVAPRNFVPGDWVYFLNTDAATREKTGYEGSNAIYLGRNRFDDYYNDHAHSYTYEQKLNEVYQWRNGVFSRSRDADKVKPLLAEDYERLGTTPANKGLVLDIRASPYFFGFEELP